MPHFPKKDLPVIPPDSELAVFRAAVADVIPVSPTPRVLHHRPKPSPFPIQIVRDEKAELVDSLSDHDPWSDRFDANEELRFLRSGVQQSVLKKLRRGHWRIDDELDLHGLTKTEARRELVTCLNQSLSAGYRCIRIIHGKGLSSTNGEAILKHQVRIWLTQREEVLAFCQAPQGGGGSGAAIVLLKQITEKNK